MKIAIFNGPNLNRLGLRKPEVYGTQTMAQILLQIQQRRPDLYLEYRQSNHEGDLIDWLQETDAEAVVINAGGYSHTSVALRDAVEECPVPVVEVHISDIRTREPFRRVSLLTDVCEHSIIGQGPAGYEQAVEWIIDNIETARRKEKSS